MSIRRDTPENIRQLIIDKFQSHISQSQISRDLNVPKSTVSDIVKKYKQTGQVTSSRGHCGGHNKRLSDRDDRAIAREAQINPQSTAREIQASVGGNVSQVSISTVKRSLRKSGKISYRPLKAPRLNKSQMTVRLQWARRHQNWTVDQWKQV